MKALIKLFSTQLKKLEYINLCKEGTTQFLNEGKEQNIVFL